TAPHGLRLHDCYPGQFSHRRDVHHGILWHLHSRLAHRWRIDGRRHRLGDAGRGAARCSGGETRPGSRAGQTRHLLLAAGYADAERTWLHRGHARLDLARHALGRLHRHHLGNPQRRRNHLRHAAPLGQDCDGHRGQRHERPQQNHGFSHLVRGHPVRRQWRDRSRVDPGDPRRRFAALSAASPPGSTFPVAACSSRMKRPMTSLLPANSPEARIFARAEWIWPDDFRWDLHNGFVLFRRDFTLEPVPRHAPLFITADQSYHLYVNGAFVGRGPARGYQSHWPYDEIDLARWLVPGRNVLAVRAYNPGYSNFQYLTEGYAGLLVAATWGRVRIQTDATWKCLRQPGIRHDMTRTSLQLFAQENFDARPGPLDWMNSDFDDSAWVKPKTQKPGVLPWASLEPR